MRSDECRFCRSRKCYTRIVLTADPKRFDELACNKHIRELERLSDSVLGARNGVMRNHISSSSPQVRGREVPS